MDSSDFKSYLILLIFIALFIIGLNLQEYAAVLEKAIKICFSCVGIG